MSRRGSARLLLHFAAVPPPPHSTLPALPLPLPLPPPPVRHCPVSSPISYVDMHSSNGWLAKTAMIVTRRASRQVAVCCGALSFWHSNQAVRAARAAVPMKLFSVCGVTSCTAEKNSQGKRPCLPLYHYLTHGRFHECCGTLVCKQCVDRLGDQHSCGESDSDTQLKLSLAAFQRVAQEQQQAANVSDRAKCAGCSSGSVCRRCVSWLAAPLFKVPCTHTRSIRMLCPCRSSKGSSAGEPRPSAGRPRRCRPLPLQRPLPLRPICWQVGHEVALSGISYPQQSPVLPCLPYAALSSAYSRRSQHCRIPRACRIPFLHSTCPHPADACSFSRLAIQRGNCTLPSQQHPSAPE